MFRKGRWYQCVHLHSPSLHHWWERRHLFLPYLPFSPPAAGPQHLTSRFTNLSLPAAPIWSSNLAFLPSLPHQKPPFCIQNKGLKLGIQDLSGQVTFPASSFPSTQCEHTSPVTLLYSLSSAFAKASTTFRIISESHSPSLQALWPHFLPYLSLTFETSVTLVPFFNRTKQAYHWTWCTLFLLSYLWTWIPLLPLPIFSFWWLTLSHSYSCYFFW